MIRVRKLERKDEDGAWRSDAYAVEMPGGQVTLRYSLAWEYLGGRYNRLIQERGLPLEQWNKCWPATACAGCRSRLVRTTSKRFGRWTASVTRPGRRRHWPAGAFKRRRLRDT